MKKILTALALLLFAGSTLAYEIDANSIFRQGDNVGLRPYSRYTISCPSIIENVNLGDRSNLRFFFLDNEPFEQGKRAASTLVIKTFNTSSSSFEIFMQDGNSSSINYDINNDNFPELNLALGAGIMVFSRLLGLMQFAPPFNRKEVPSMVRIALALIVTVIVTMLVKPQPIPEHTSILLAILLNYAFGAILGYIANCILSAVSAGGDMINMQMGLSSAMVLDPTTRSQTSILGNYFTILGLIIFISAGGAYWLINAFIRSFDVFGMYQTIIPLSQVINPDYLVLLTSNVLYFGMQLAAPILLATLGQDIILGIISKTAPQVNVFQLSFLFKPIMGALIMIWILPMLISVITDYMTSYANIF